MRTYNRLQPARKISASQIKELCRLCMSVDSSMYDIFTSSEDNLAVSLSSKILKCLSIEVKDNNGFPTKVCACCLRSLNAFTEFWEQCQVTNIKLHQLIENSKPSSSLEVIFQPSPTYSGYDELYKSPEQSQVNSADDDDPTTPTESPVYYQSLLSDSLESGLLVGCNESIPLDKDSSNDLNELPGEISNYVPSDVNLLGNENGESVREAPPTDFQLEEVIDMNEGSDSVEVQVSMNGNSYIVKVLDQSQEKDNDKDKVVSLPSSTVVEEGKDTVEEAKDTTGECSQSVEAVPVPQSKISMQCPHCQESYHNKSDLKTHLKTHKDVKGFSCKICFKLFSLRGSLVRHEKIHSGERPYKCDQCSKSFTQKEVLRRHALTHSGNKPHKCDSCDKSYTQKEALRMHIKNNHGSRKYMEIIQYKCSLCEKSFCHLSGLSRHQKSHEGKKYPCQHCDRVFTDGSCLRRHNQRLHLDKPGINGKKSTNNAVKQGGLA